MVNKKTGQTGVGYITVSRRKNIANSVRALRQWKTRAARVCRGWPPVAPANTNVCSCGYVATLGSLVYRPIRRSN